MNRFKLLIMTMNRFRPFLCTTFILAVTALFSGTSPTFAGVDPVAAKGTAVKDPAAAKRADAAAKRALAKRAEMLKQRKAAREYVQKVVEGQQPGATDNAGKGGAR